MVGHARNLRDSRKRINFFAGKYIVRMEEDLRNRTHLERVLKNEYTFFRF